MYRQIIYKTYTNNYDLIIVGGGHAGIEAANIASKFNLKTLLITKNINEIGKIECNPSIGGVGKGQIVRELDSLGGIMPKATTFSCTNSKTLNKSKGEAVQSTRNQIDKHLYHTFIIKKLYTLKKLKILENKVKKIITINKNYICVEIKNKIKFYSKTLILSTGTHINKKKIIGLNKKKINKKNYYLNINIKLNKKFKTGTPPRILIKKKNIKNLFKLKKEKNYTPFSFYLKNKKIKYIPCWKTKTSKKTKNIIKKYKKLSSKYSNNIKSNGPRYCPSIEEKYTIYKKKKQNIFLERESVFNKIIYMGGISTSLPENIQTILIHSIKKLNQSIICKYGYSVEYNYCQKKYINNNLEFKNLKNVFLAGQINGTTGYEESAAQGIYSGINSFKKIFKKKINIINKNSYIKTLINNIIKNNLNEPFRIHTSDSKNKIGFREDNCYKSIFKHKYNHKNISKKKYNYIKNLYKLFKKIKKPELKKKIPKTNIKYLFIKNIISKKKYNLIKTNKIRIYYKINKNLNLLLINNLSNENKANIKKFILKNTAIFKQECINKIQNFLKYIKKNEHIAFKIY